MYQIKSVVQSAIVIALGSFLLACSKPDIFVQEQQFFDQQVVNNPAIETRYLERGDFKLRYASAGMSDAPVIVYLHGTPGGWDNGARYLMDDQLLERALVISLDRPGWGGSQLPEGGVEASFAGQNRLLKPLFDQLDRENNHRGIILVGHSLGASLAGVFVKRGLCCQLDCLALAEVLNMNAKFLLAPGYIDRIGSNTGTDCAASSDKGNGRASHV